MPGVMDIVTGVMQSLVEDTLAASAAATPAAAARPATPEPSEVAPPADATPTPATPAQAVPTSTNEPTLAEVWNADHASDPYRVYQQMDENGWTAADLAQASGMTEQQAGDWLTRLGAQAGFGGSVTVGRDAIDNPFTTAMTAAQQSGTGPGWVAAAPESRAKDDPDDGGTPSTAFDVGAFTQWYVSQDTPAAQAFARVQGAFTVDSGVVRFASGATASMQRPDPVTRDTPSPSVPVFSWQADQRVADYQTFAKGDAFSLASMAQDIETPANDQLIQVFGNANAPLPENEMGERMRAMYGTPLATYMVRLQTATDAMRSKYVGALNQALAQRPTSPDASSPFWTAHSSPGAVHWDGNQGRQVTDPPVVTYTFDTDAFSQWYAQQGQQAQLIQQTFGAGIVATAGGFGTTGSTTPLSFSVNTSAYDEASPSGNDAWYLSNAGPDVPSVSDSTLGLKLQEFTLGDPPPMHDDRLVSFLPGYGFVTPEANVKQDDLLEQIVDLAAVAVVTYFSAGTLGPEVAGGLGFAQGSLGAAMVTAAVTGMASTTVSEAISGDLQLKGILKAGLAGALSGGMLNELQGVTGSLGLLGKVGAQALTQGSVQALMGGSFEQGAIAGGISGFASAVSDNINGSITQQVNAGLMTPAQAVAARYTGSMLSAAIKIAGSGPNTSGYAEACAFINDTCADIASATASSPAAASVSVVPAPTSSSSASSQTTIPGQTSWLTPPSDSVFAPYSASNGQAPAAAPQPVTLPDAAPAPIQEATSTTATAAAAAPVTDTTSTATLTPAAKSGDLLALFLLDQQSRYAVWSSPMSSPFGDVFDTSQSETASDQQREAAERADQARHGVQQVVINGTPAAWSPSQSLAYSSDDDATYYPLETQGGGRANLYVNGQIDPATGDFVPGAPSGASLSPEDLDMARARLGYLNSNYDEPGGWHNVKTFFGAGSPVMSTDQLAEKANIGSILDSTTVSTSAPYDELGLQTMQDSGPIWHGVVEPTAQRVGAVPADMAEFKYGVQTELADEAGDAAHREDESAIDRISVKQVIANLIPASPQELALGVAGGAVAGKVAGVVGGTLASKVPALGLGVDEAVGRAVYASSQGFGDVGNAGGSGGEALIGEGEATAAGPNDASFPLGSKRLQFNQPEGPWYQPIRNDPTTIGETDYSGHAIDRMQDRGVVPSVVQNAIDVGAATPSRMGTTVYYDPVNNVSVVTNAQGKVITVKYGR